MMDDERRNKLDSKRDAATERKAPKELKKKRVWPWAVVACAGLLLVLVNGWNVVGNFTRTGNSTLAGMSGAPTDGGGVARDPFTSGAEAPSGNVGNSGIVADGYDPYRPAGTIEDYESGIPPYGYGDGYSTDGEGYNYTPESGFKSVSAEPLSTFAADVDTASYSNVRRLLQDGRSVPPDAVRVEEMVNYFNYDYPEPARGEPFSVTTEVGACPWNEDSSLLRIGMQAAAPDMSDRKPSNLVFLVDVSGSMYDDDKLPLVKQAFGLLTEELHKQDRVSVVTYADGDEVVLRGAEGTDGSRIRYAIDSLEAGGGTNGSAGIETAYAIAEENFIDGGINRIILATDGDLNIGMTSQGDLVRLVEDKAKSGVTLSILGFGTGNLQDGNMEAMADHGDGNYYYIDSVMEARRVLVEQLGGTLGVVAKDVKFQVEFNPAQVGSYRLVGYENREMAASDFVDDTKDGGEVGQGHRVTVLYELVRPDGTEPGLKYGSKPAKASDELCTVSVRYKEPDGDTSKLLEYPVGPDRWSDDPSGSFRFAACVAEAGMLLRGSEHVGGLTYRDVLEQLDWVELDDPYKQEFRELVQLMHRAE